jgi:dTDP-4-amino-4,6-dideoxygalactose transaminase
MIILSKPIISEKEIESVVEVMKSGMLAGGKRVAEFEVRFAAMVGSEHAVALGSGTAALHIGLMAAEIGPGDEVIVPSFTFAATANSVRMVGAEPVFVDVDPDDFTIHADHIEAAITDRTRAVMPVHLYGQMAPMTEIMELASRHGIDVIEDAAQAHLATTNGLNAGSVGRFGAFSFYPTKNMTTGEGGMITTSDTGLADRARMLRNQGMSERYVHPMVGLNERMTEIEGAIGLVQLGNVEDWTKRRREIAAIYQENLKPELGLPVERDDAVHVYHQYTLSPAVREPVTTALQAAEIGHGIYYPTGTHEQTPYRGPEYNLPVTDDLTRRVVSIPVRPDLTDGELATITSTLNEVDL